VWVANSKGNNALHTVTKISKAETTMKAWFMALDLRRVAERRAEQGMCGVYAVS